jgi:tetratricopeptide (TPR) repeat protein
MGCSGPASFPDIHNLSVTGDLPESEPMARPRFVGLALALVTLLLYLPVTWHGFINYDDPDYITENVHVQSGLSADGIRWAFTTWHASNWHPLTWLSHMLDCDLFALDPGPHHLGNVLLHTVNALLLLVLLYRMTGWLWSARVVAALFAWHPLHVQSVAWAAERKDVLSTTFWFLTLLAYHRYIGASTNRSQPGSRPASAAFTAQARKWYTLALLLFALGLMSKPMLVTLPFTLLVLDFWPLRRLRLLGRNTGALESPGLSLARLVAEKWPFFVLSAISSVVTFLAQRAEAVVALERHPLSDRIGNALCSYARYLFQTVWPANLAVIYPLPKNVSVACVAVSLVFVVAVSVYVWRQRTKCPHLISGWCWYLGTLVPVIGLIQVGGQAMADRYTYVPLIGIFWAVVVELRQWFDQHRNFLRYGIAVTTLVMAVCLFLSSKELRYWKSSENLFERAVAVTRDNAVAHINLGAAYELAGRKAEALREYKEALRVNPGMGQAHNNLASLLEESGQYEEALFHYREALRLKPGAWQANANLAACLARLGRLEEAAAPYLSALRLAPGDPRPPYAMGKALLIANRRVEAVQRFRDALRLNPNHLQTLVYLSRLRASAPEQELRNGPEAIELAERAKAIAGEQEYFLLDTLAMAYAEAGRYPEAIGHLKKAIELLRAGGDPARMKELETRMRLYETGRPFREEPGKHADSQL